MRVRKLLRVVMVLGFLPALMAAECPEFCSEFPEICEFEEEEEAQVEAAPADAEEIPEVEVAVVQS